MWEPNIQRLEKIEKEDPIFWTYLVEMALVLEKSPFYIDDHIHYTQEESEIPYIAIGQQYFRDTLIPCQKDTQFPTAWVYPAIFMSQDWVTSQCKNPLYINNGVVHLSTCATGSTLYKEEIANLRQNKVSVQSTWNGVTEKNFVLPIALFNRHVLREHHKII